MGWQVTSFFVALLLIVCFNAYAQEELRSKRFLVRFDEPDRTTAEWTLGVLEKAADEFKDRLPFSGPPVIVRIAPTASSFSVYTVQYKGADVTGVAESTRGVIVVKSPRLTPLESSFAGTLRHELVHVLIARNGLRENMPVWFNEGLAMRLSGEYRFSGPARVAGMYTKGTTLSYTELENAFSFSLGRERFSDAYAQSQSMTTQLYKRLGNKSFWELVHGLRKEQFEPLLKHYTGMTPEAFVEEWRRSLWAVAIVTTLVSGFSVFQLGALLLLLAHWRKRKRNRQIMREWELEEAMEFLKSSNDTAPEWLESDGEDWK